MVQKIMRRWRQKKESWIDPRRIVDWFRQAGPGAAIFPIRPFLGTSSFFPTKTGGLGVLLELAGVEVDGAARTDVILRELKRPKDLAAIERQSTLERHQILRRQASSG